MTTPNKTLLQSLRRILRPLVRLFIRNGVTLQMTSDLFKELYVNAAEESLQKETGKATDSHISLMTGVHRKDVKKYRNLRLDMGEAPPHVSVGAELLGKWLGLPEFLDPQGNPVPLPYQNKEDPERSFCALAESVSKDIRPRAMLDEFIRQGIAVHDPLNNTVALQQDAFVPRDGIEEKLYYFGRNSGDHMEASVHNLLGQQHPFFDRSVYYDELTEESAQELQKLANDSGMKTLRTINRKALELSERDKNKPGALWRINFGAFFFSSGENDKNEK
ncbi:MAG: DUF6502 family protein [Alphaproteobacteria bacterium]|nr:DUF6502 family protein [Alphaproteobacteria bacterium]